MAIYGWYAVTLGCLVLSALAFSVHVLTYKSKRKGVESQWITN
jgi:hypothetical protein